MVIWRAFWGPVLWTNTVQCTAGWVVGLTGWLDDYLIGFDSNLCAALCCRVCSASQKADSNAITSWRLYHSVQLIIIAFVWFAIRDGLEELTFENQRAANVDHFLLFFTFMSFFNYREARELITRLLSGLFVFWRLILFTVSVLKN